LRRTSRKAIAEGAGWPRKVALPKLRQPDTDSALRTLSAVILS
jgi:hypothetical protein